MSASPARSAAQQRQDARRAEKLSDLAEAVADGKLTVRTMSAQELAAARAARDLRSAQRGPDQRRR